MGDTGELPISVALAWGRRERPGRGPKPGLSLDRIVAAAVGVAASDGLAAVSMSRVAAELGAATMSLYRYVPAKDDLLMLMLDRASGDPPPPVDGEGWRAGLERWAWGVLAAYRQHPWMVRIPVNGPPTGPNQTAWLERGLACLRDTGLPPAEKTSVLLLLGGVVRNWAGIEADILEAGRRSGVTPDEAMADYARTLAQLIDPQRFPELTEVLHAGVVDHADGPDDEFVFGLRCALDGVEALIGRRQA